MSVTRRNKLEASVSLHQFLRDIVDQESWIKEKKVLASSTDYGKDLPDVQNLRKKMQRLTTELKSHQPIVENILEQGQQFQEQNPQQGEEIGAKCDELSNNWKELNNLTNDRYIPNHIVYKPLSAKVKVTFSRLSSLSDFIF